MDFKKHNYSIDKNGVVLLKDTSTDVFEVSFVVSYLLLCAVFYYLISSSVMSAEVTKTTAPVWVVKMIGCLSIATPIAIIISMFMAMIFGNNRPHSLFIYKYGVAVQNSELFVTTHPKVKEIKPTGNHLNFVLEDGRVIATTISSNKIDEFKHLIEVDNPKE